MDWVVAVGGQNSTMQTLKSTALSIHLDVLAGLGLDRL